MFHVKHIFQKLAQAKLHRLLFWLFLISVPFQTRIIYNKPQAFIGTDFSYHLAVMVYLSDLLFAVICFTWLFTDFPKNSIKSRFFAFLGITALIPGLDLFHVQHFQLFLFAWLKWVEGLTLIWYISTNFRKIGDFLGFFWIIYLSGLAQALLAIQQFHVQRGLGLAWLGEYIPGLGTPGLATIDLFGQKILRAYGTFSHPNVLAGFLVIAFISGVYLLVSRETPWQKLGVSLGLFLMIFGLFFTFSRSAWLALAVGLVCYFVFLFQTKQLQTLKILGFMILVSCGTIGFLFQDLAVSRGTQVLDTKAIQYRTDFNQQALAIWTKTPIIGAGIGNYVPTYETMKPGLPGWQYQPPHNIFLFWTTELGLVGIVWLVIALGLLIRFTWNHRTPLAFAVKLCLLALLVLGLFDHYLATIQQGRLILFLILGSLAALGFVSRETTSFSSKDRVK